MVDFKRLGTALSGMGAGFQGQGPQWMIAQQRQQQLDMAQKERERQEAQQRQGETKLRTANTIRLARQRMEENPVAAIPAINELIMGIPGAAQGPLGKVKQALMASQSTGVMQPGQKEQLLNQAREQLRALDDSFVNQGLLKPETQEEPPKPVTLSRGARLVNPNTGDVIAENPDETQGAAGHNRASAISRAYDNGTTLKVLPDGTTEVTDPAGNVVTGADRLNVLRTAREEQIEFARQRAEAGGIGAGSSERINETIINGMDVASSAATLRRGLDLLKEVRTGGLNAVATRARQLFGVEGADEGELSANLGQAILSQLRPIFGAQFTEREGARLERISAGLGRNTETNERLLKQLLSVVERDANRAIDAAISIRDFRTADEIQELLNFDLSDDYQETPEPSDELTEDERKELEELKEWFNANR